MQKDQYQHPDYYLLDELLTDEHKLIRDAVRAYVKKEISPIIEEHAQNATFPKQILKGLGELGCFGPFVPQEYGGAGLDYISYGIMMQELERGDSGVRSTASVQGSLVMYPILTYGSEEQKMKYLPKLADIAVVWAKNEEGRIQGLIVERGMEGFTTPETHGKWSLRASATGELVFDNVKVPKENILPNVIGLKGPLGCLSSARFGIAWGALGCAMDCYDTALRYSQQRIQFDKPIGAFQLTQKKLAEMITEITKGQLMVWRLGVLRNEHRATPEQISMAKRNSCETAITIAREARQILGGMGITGEFSIMRHMMNLESVITYEGTHDIHLLITGQSVTGFNAFK